MLTAPEHLLLIHMDRDGLQNEALHPFPGTLRLNVTMVCNYLGTVRWFPNWSDAGNPPNCLQRTAIGF